MKYRNFRSLNYQEIGKRIRSEREKLRYTLKEGQFILSPEGKKMSQEKLLQYMDDHSLPHFGRNTLSNIENGDPVAISGVTIGRWEALCSVFSCSIGYLLGEYDCRSFDREFIKDETGLSEEAISKLSDMKLLNRRSAHCDIVSLLIESHNCEYFLALIGKSISYSLSGYEKPDQLIALDLDGTEMKVMKQGLVDSVFQTHLVQNLPALAEEYSLKYEKSPDQLWKEYADHMRPIQQKLFDEEITSEEFDRLEREWLSGET